MAKFNEYPAKTIPKDADKFMLYSAEDSANKLIDYDKLADAVLDKLTSKQFTLDQGTKTLLSALNELNSNLLFTRIASTDETNQATINLSELEHGVYELYSTVGTYCTIGYSNGNWWLPVKSSENTTISGESLTFDAGSWYTIIYIRKIL